MGLVRLVYASALSENCGVTDLGNILREARDRNREIGLTGLLCYDLRYFLQWLEGPRRAVNSLYAAILKDPRHTGALLIEYAEADCREFTDWAMGVVSARDSARELLFKYCPSGEFEPFELTATAAKALMIELARERRQFLSKTVAELESQRGS